MVASPCARCVEAWIVQEPSAVREAIAAEVHVAAPSTTPRGRTPPRTTGSTRLAVPSTARSVTPVKKAAGSRSLEAPPVKERRPIDIFVNGKRLEVRTRLCHGDELRVGTTHCFKLAIPEAAADSNLPPGQELSRYLQLKFGFEKSSVVLSELRKLRGLVEEANDMTEHLRGGEGFELVFKEHLLTEVFGDEVPDLSVALRRFPRAESSRQLPAAERAGALLAVWPIEVFKQRLEVLRLLCAEVDRRAVPWGRPGDPDPWKAGHRVSVVSGSQSPAEFRRLDSSTLRPDPPTVASVAAAVAAAKAAVQAATGQSAQEAAGGVGPQEHLSRRFNELVDELTEARAALASFRSASAEDRSRSASSSPRRPRLPPPVRDGDSPPHAATSSEPVPTLCPPRMSVDSVALARMRSAPLPSQRSSEPIVPGGSGFIYPGPVAGPGRPLGSVQRPMFPQLAPVQGVWSSQGRPSSPLWSTSAVVQAVQTPRGFVPTPSHGPVVVAARASSAPPMGYQASSTPPALFRQQLPATQGAPVQWQQAGPPARSPLGVSRSPGCVSPQMLDVTLASTIGSLPGQAQPVQKLRPPPTLSPRVVL